MVKVPTSKLIYNGVYKKDTRVFDYIEYKRLRWLSKIDIERFIDRDIRVIEERGESLSNYVFNPSLTLENIYNLLFVENIYNKLTFSEQIIVINLFKNISDLLRIKENESLKELNRRGELLEKSISLFKDSYKIEYLREDHEKVLAYWNRLYKLSCSYERKRKELLDSARYILGSKNDILEDSIQSLVVPKVIISAENRLILPILINVLQDISLMKKTEFMSEEEQQNIKRLELR